METASQFELLFTTDHILSLEAQLDGNLTMSDPLA